jgi:hypothetical protein|tara:strand:- start:973 stop:1212 length:240 start_codon:yes stop_codon:yes gene_type:complete
MSLYSTGFAVGDLVTLVQSIDWVDFSAFSGELAIVVEIYPTTPNSSNGYIYDCRLKLSTDGEIDVWFGEIKKITFEECE